MKNHEQVVQQEAEIMQERSDWTVGESVYHSKTLWTPPAAR